MTPAPKKKITIALDAMGGDHAPHSVVKGAHHANKRYRNLEFLMFGDESRIGALVENFSGLSAITKIIHTDDVIHDNDKPSAALRKGKNSSMYLAVNAVQEGKAEGAVSAGNTGALMAISKINLKTLPGISRPAIASIFPTVVSECVLLDLGANIDCTPENLFEFAVMGDAFARTVLGLTHPKVGLLNIGSEEMKGNEVIKAAWQLLKNTHLPINFHGYIEGNDIAQSIVDVVVTDGFTGNVCLKTAEGTAKICGNFLKHAFQSSILAKISYLLAKPALITLFNKLDPRLYNGAMFLGLNGIVVKSHGGTDWLGFANAIGVAYELASHKINDQIIKELQVAGVKEES